MTSIVLFHSYMYLERQTTPPPPRPAAFEHHRDAGWPGPRVPRVLASLRCSSNLTCVEPCHSNMSSVSVVGLILCLVWTSQWGQLIQQRGERTNKHCVLETQMTGSSRLLVPGLSFEQLVRSNLHDKIHTF